MTAGWNFPRRAVFRPPPHPHIMRFAAAACHALLFTLPAGALAADAAPAAPAAPPVVLPGEAVTETEIRGLLAKLAELQSKQDVTDRNALSEALRVLRAASVGPTEAVNLYVASVRAVEFEKAGKKQADFDDWKKRNDDRLHEIPFGKALMMQYGFLKLALESDTEEKRRAAGTKLVTLADEFTKALPALGAHGKMLGEDPFTQVVAQRFGLARRKPEGWPSSPLQLAALHAFVMTPVRREAPKDLPAMWETRIRQERALYTVREDMAKAAARKPVEAFGKKISKNEPPPPAPVVEDALVVKGDKFEQAILPKLQWEMGEDLYRSGLRRKGLDCLFGVIMKNPNHPARADWIKSLNDKATGVAAEAGISIPAAGRPADPVSVDPAPAVPVVPAAPAVVPVDDDPGLPQA